MSSRTRLHLSSALGLGLAVTGLQLIATPSAVANPAGTGLVISEVYGGGGNSGSTWRNDFVELYNPTDAAISVEGWSVQGRSAANTAAATATNTTRLTGSVPAHGHYLIQQAAGAGGTQNLPAPNATGEMGLAAGGWQIWLSNGTTPLDPTDGNVLATPDPAIIDFVGGATSATSFEAAPVGVASTATLSIQRNASNTDTDNNATDFAIAAPTPTNAAGETTPALPPLTVTAPGNQIGVLGQEITPITLSATGGTAPYTWSAAGLPDGVTLTGDTISGSPTTVGTATVTVTAEDSSTPKRSDSKTFTVNVTAAVELTPIAALQGTGPRSPFAPATGNGSGTAIKTTEGVVTAVYPAGGFNGVYLQTPGADTPDASDGIFVYGGPTNANVPSTLALGDSVRVTGPVAEFNNLTQIVPGAGGVAKLETSLGTVTPKAVAYPQTDAAREVLEGELIAPTGAFTVTNNYNVNAFAEIGLATGTTPLKQMTEYAAPSDKPAIDAIKAENAERGVLLDDGSSLNYMTNATAKNQPLPWLTPTNPVRVGARVTFTGPVVLDWRNNAWKLQPTEQVTDAGADVATFEDTRDDNLVPQDVGGDLKIATFNVLNYFNTTGHAYVDSGAQQNPPIVTHCAYYTDRDGNDIGNDQCGVKQPGETYTSSNPNDGRGPRGAATDASLARQEAKLVHTINALGADVVGLEEIENSIKLPGESNRDDAVADLVGLLNEADPGTWAYVRSPGEAMTAAAVAEQDVIRPAFIYKGDRVEPVGQSDILFGTTQFANAREPLAQAFKATGAPDADAFAVIVNHFKSKGDNPAGVPAADGDNKNDADTGVGAFNGDRTRQAARLVEFADDFAAERDIDAVFLAGDFNSYTMEEPIDALEQGGFELIESDQAGDESYSYNGLSGSLDHVLGNAAAMAMVTGADIWEINAHESVAFQYSRFNYNATDFWQPELPFATSDHNPEIVGVDVPDYTPTDYQEIQVLGTNDFHGRLLPDAGNAAGAAPFATAVEELRQQNPNTVFAAAGDLVGASTFESFVQDDEPTIDALNAMGLEVSAAGNHEFDRGYDDLVGRIQDRADWEYIAANVDVEPGMTDLAETWTKTIDGKRIGFVGAVTEDLPALVNPAGIAGVTVTDVVDATNAAAAALRSGPEPVDLVVLLVHEGSPTTDCASSSFTDAATTWGNIVQNTSADVDAIISGHTHLAYNCRFPVEDWVSGDRAVTKRPVVSAGQYGTNLNKLVFKFDTASDELVAVTQDVVATAGVGYAPDPTVQGIVDAAVDFAAVEGAKPLGKMGGPFDRATYRAQNTDIENRGGESTLSNQVAEVQRWATDEAGIDTDLALMNPGGLRADMPGTADGELRSLSYRQAADVQPFANTLVNLQLTGAQLEEVLEEQWQRNAAGGVPSRPFLRLGVSAGFTYTYTERAVTVSVPNAAPVNTFEGEVTGMWLDGEPVEPAASYSVTVNSFLGGGGDNFWTLADGTDKVDTGKVDLEAMVDYMAQYQSAENPLAVDYRQRGVEVTFPPNAPETYAPGATVAFDVASWSMSAANDERDRVLQVKLGDEVLGTATVDSTVGTTPYDNAGTASVSVPLPAQGLPDGRTTLMLVGPETGTEVPVEITVDDGEQVVQVLATNDFHGRIPQTASSGEAGAAVLAGAVKQLRAQNPDTVFAAAGDLIGASTFDSFVQRDKPTIDALNEAGLDVSAVGNHELDGGYADLIERVMADYDAEDNPLGGAEWQYIAANLKMKATGDDAVPATFIQEFGNIQIGFVGAVTEDLPSLVNPDGIAELDVLDIVESVNAEATELKADGADAVVMLVHEGAPSTACAPQNVPGTTWGDIVTGVNADVDAIVSGHTHLAYDCRFPVAAWADRPVKERPVVSAGQYGMNLNQLKLTFDNDAELQSIQQALLPLMGPDPDGSGPGLPPALYPADPATKQIVDAAVTAAGPIGDQVLGQIAAPFSRAKYSNGTENRGSSSTAGNLIAEVQRWATPERLGAQIAFMNPGGIRGDMVGSGSGAFPRDLTYRQAANVQSFANSLINMRLTGEQIKTALEQQWQRTAGGTVPTRAFLRLGVSEGFTYTYEEIDDPAIAGAKKGVVTGMWLDGEPIDPAATYSVTVNSFLSPGGDNFRAFAGGTEKTDWGMTDLQSMVDYFDEFGSGAESIEPAYDQRAVQVQFPAGAPASYEPGDTVAFDLAALAMTGSAAGVADKKDGVVEVFLGEESLGTATVDNSIGEAPDNNTTVKDAGKASVRVDLPADLTAGPVTLTVRGATTGTEIPVVVEVAEGAAATVAAEGDSITWGQAAAIDVTVTGNQGTPTGTIEVRDGETVLGSAPLADGVVAVPIAARSVEPGEHDLTVVYSGDDTYDEVSEAVVLTVAKATSPIAADNVSFRYGKAATVRVRLDPSATGTVSVRAGNRVLGSAAVGAGEAVVTLPAKSLTPGTTTLTASYSGDGRFVPGSATLTARVAKATSRTRGSVTPKKIAVRKTRATVRVVVTGADGVRATGKVKITVAGQGTRTVTVRDGRATLRLAPFSSTGRKKVTVRYLGSALLEPSSDRLSLPVRRKR